jgi:hypothetical protein
VTDWSGAISCSGPPDTGRCSASYSEQVVQLVLEASPASSFAGWSGLGGEIGIPEDNCRGLTNPCMVWLSNDKTLTATFDGPGFPEGPQCLIEPWYCEGEEPECLIEPWECKEEEPELQVCHGEFCSYIVVFRDWVDDPAAVAHEQVEKYDGRLGFVYQHALKGYSAEYRTSVIGEVACEPSVKYVEKDQIVEALGASSSGQGDSLIEGGECEGEDPEPEPPPADDVSQEPVPKWAPFKHCGAGSVHRYGQCARRRAVAHRVCRKRKGASRRRCMRRAMRRLKRLERHRVRVALRARR